MATSPRALLLYHFFAPDDEVSSRLFAMLAEDLAAAGWDVTAAPSNRNRRDPRIAYPRRERIGSVAVRRIWRPPLSQSGALGRIANAAWMIARWSLLALRRDLHPDVVIVGTDPILSVLTAWAWKRMRPRVRIAHWAFDLYPEAAIADGRLRERSTLARMLRAVLRRAYGSCDLIADIGPCMRQRLDRYRPTAKRATLTPWALVEPPEIPEPDPQTRRRLFGDARLALLYSGNLGRAHSFEPFLELARALESDGVHFAFAVRGERVAELERALRSGPANVSLAPFAREEDLARHLAAADVHLASLRPEWSGLVVPSKFFGSLAMGRPVLFAGARSSAIARWIEEHRAGWIADEASRPELLRALAELARSPARVAEIRHRCKDTYRRHFARNAVASAWERELRSLLVDPARTVNATRDGAVAGG